MSYEDVEQLDCSLEKVRAPMHANCYLDDCQIEDTKHHNKHCRLRSCKDISLTDILNMPNLLEGGVVDSDYRGEICVLLKNNNDREFVVKTYLAIAQLVFLQCFSPQLFIVGPEEELTSTGRGIGGFGSTGCMQGI
nr:deoxyuridine 5'-triphosphate nucleotidohydrolase-like [Hydra vulgaris]